MTVPGKPLRPDEEWGLELFGAWVRRGRRKLGVSQHTLGQLVGVHQSVISRLENGKLSGLRFPHIGALVARLADESEPWLMKRWASNSDERLP